MEQLLPSEIARLVYGYFEESGCQETAIKYLEECPHLAECLDLHRKGRKFKTKVDGYSLMNILDEYSEIRNLASERLQRFPESNVENLRNNGNLLAQLKFLLDSTKPGETLLLSITVPPQGSSAQISSSNVSSVIPNRSRVRVPSNSEKGKRIPGRCQDSKQQRRKDAEDQRPCCSNSLLPVEATPLESLPGLIHEADEDRGGSQKSRSKNIHTCSKEHQGDSQGEGSSEHCTVHTNQCKNRCYDKRQSSKHHSSSEDFLNSSFSEDGTYLLNSTPKRKNNIVRRKNTPTPLKVQMTPGKAQTTPPKSQHPPGEDDTCENPDFQALVQAFMDNKMHERLAERINKVISVPVPEETVVNATDINGPSISSGTGVVSEEASSSLTVSVPAAVACDNELNQVIKTIVDQTEQDPFFERFLQEIVGPVEEEMTPSPAETQSDDGGEGVTNEPSMESSPGNNEEVISENPMSSSESMKCRSSKADVSKVASTSTAGKKSPCASTGSKGNQHSHADQQQNAGTAEGGKDVPLKQRLRSARQRKSDTSSDKGSPIVSAGEEKEETSLEDQNAAAIECIVKARITDENLPGSCNSDQQSAGKELPQSVSSKENSQTRTGQSDEHHQKENVPPTTSSPQKDISHSTTSNNKDGGVDKGLNSSVDCNGEGVIIFDGEVPYINTSDCLRNFVMNACPTETRSSQASVDSSSGGQVMTITIPSSVEALPHPPSVGTAAVHPPHHNITTSSAGGITISTITSTVPQTQLQQTTKEQDVVSMSTVIMCGSDGLIPQFISMAQQNTGSGYLLSSSTPCASASIGRFIPIAPRTGEASNLTGNSQQLVASVMTGISLASPPEVASTSAGTTGKKRRSVASVVTGTPLAPPPEVASTSGGVTGKKRRRGRPKSKSTVSKVSAASGNKSGVKTRSQDKSKVITLYAGDGSDAVVELQSSSVEQTSSSVGLSLPKLLDSPQVKLLGKGAESSVNSSKKSEPENPLGVRNLKEAQGVSPKANKTKTNAMSKTPKGKKAKTVDPPSPQLVSLVNLSKNNIVVNSCQKASPQVPRSSSKRDSKSTGLQKPRETPSSSSYQRRASINSKRMSMSTPKRRVTRVLDFTTPPKNGNSALRKANTSPKAIQSAVPFSESSQKVVTSSQRIKSSSVVRSSLFSPESTKTPAKSENVGDPCKVPPIATRSPAPQLTGDWDKITGVGLIIHDTSPGSQATCNGSSFEDDGKGEDEADTGLTNTKDKNEEATTDVQNSDSVQTTAAEINSNDDQVNTPNQSNLSVSCKSKSGGTWDADLRALVCADYGPNVFVQNNSPKKATKKGRNSSKNTKSVKLKETSGVTESEARSLEDGLNDALNVSHTLPSNLTDESVQQATLHNVHVNNMADKENINQSLEKNSVTRKEKECTEGSIPCNEIEDSNSVKCAGIDCKESTGRNNVLENDTTEERNSSHVEENVPQSGTKCHSNESIIISDLEASVNKNTTIACTSECGKDGEISGELENSHSAESSPENISVEKSSETQNIVNNSCEDLNNGETKRNALNEKSSSEEPRNCEDEENSEEEHDKRNDSSVSSDFSSSSENESFESSTNLSNSSKAVQSPMELKTAKKATANQDVQQTVSDVENNLVTYVIRTEGKSNLPKNHISAGNSELKSNSQKITENNTSETHKQISTISTVSSSSDIHIRSEELCITTEVRATISSHSKTTSSLTTEPAGEQSHNSLTLTAVPVLDTPQKEDENDVSPWKTDIPSMPLTPRMISPNAKDTPLTKVVEGSYFSLSGIDTPTFPPTPQIPVTPCSNNFNEDRQDCYSSCSSYYKPSAEEGLNTSDQPLEQVLIAECNKLEKQRAEKSSKNTCQEQNETNRNIQNLPSVANDNTMQDTEDNNGISSNLTEVDDIAKNPKRSDSHKEFSGNKATTDLDVDRSSESLPHNNIIESVDRPSEILPHNRIIESKCHEKLKEISHDANIEKTLSQSRNDVNISHDKSDDKLERDKPGTSHDKAGKKQSQGKLQDELTLGKSYKVAGEMGIKNHEMEPNSQGSSEKSKITKSITKKSNKLKAKKNIKSSSRRSKTLLNTAVSCSDSEDEFALKISQRSSHRKKKKTKTEMIEGCLKAARKELFGYRSPSDDYDFASSDHSESERTLPTVKTKDIYSSDRVENHSDTGVKKSVRFDCDEREKEELWYELEEKRLRTLAKLKSGKPVKKQGKKMKSKVEEKPDITVPEPKNKVSSGKDLLSINAQLVQRGCTDTTTNTDPPKIESVPKKRNPHVRVEAIAERLTRDKKAIPAKPKRSPKKTVEEENDSAEDFGYLHLSTDDEGAPSEDPRVSQIEIQMAELHGEKEGVVNVATSTPMQFQDVCRALENTPSPSKLIDSEVQNLAPHTEKIHHKLFSDNKASIPGTPTSGIVKTSGGKKRPRSAEKEESKNKKIKLLLGYDVSPIKSTQPVDSGILRKLLTSSKKKRASPVKKKQISPSKAASKISPKQKSPEKRKPSSPTKQRKHIQKEPRSRSRDEDSSDVRKVTTHSQKKDLQEENYTTVPSCRKMNLDVNECYIEITYPDDGPKGFNFEFGDISNLGLSIDLDEDTDGNPRLVKCTTTDFQDLFTYIPKPDVSVEYKGNRSKNDFKIGKTAWHEHKDDRKILYSHEQRKRSHESRSRRQSFSCSHKSRSPPVSRPGMLSRHRSKRSRSLDRALTSCSTEHGRNIPSPRRRSTETVQEPKSPLCKLYKEMRTERKEFQESKQDRSYHSRRYDEFVTRRKGRDRERLSDREYSEEFSHTPGSKQRIEENEKDTRVQCMKTPGITERVNLHAAKTSVNKLKEPSPSSRQTEKTFQCATSEKTVKGGDVGSVNIDHFQDRREHLPRDKYVEKPSNVSRDESLQLTVSSTSSTSPKAKAEPKEHTRDSKESHGPKSHDEPLEEGELRDSDCESTADVQKKTCETAGQPIHQITLKSVTSEDDLMTYALVGSDRIENSGEDTPSYIGEYENLDPPQEKSKNPVVQEKKMLETEKSRELTQQKDGICTKSSDDIRVLPPKKRKASTEEITGHVEKKKHAEPGDEQEDPKSLLQSVNVDIILDYIHGEEKAS